MVAGCVLGTDVCHRMIKTKVNMVQGQEDSPLNVDSVQQCFGLQVQWAASKKCMACINMIAAKTLLQSPAKDVIAYMFFNDYQSLPEIIVRNILMIHNDKGPSLLTLNHADPFF